MSAVDGDATAGHEVGWGRALVSGVVILAVGFVAVVYVPNAIVTKLTSLSRGTRQDLATVVCLVAITALAWALRRLQARRLI